MRPKRMYPFDTYRFRRDEGLTVEQFAQAIGKDFDLKRVLALDDGRALGLTTFEHSHLCRLFGREKVSAYYQLPDYAI